MNYKAMEEAGRAAYSHQTYIVLNTQLKAEIEKCIPELRAMSPMETLESDPQGEDGWRKYLCRRTAQIMGKTDAAVERHLYTVMHLKRRTSMAEMADGYMLACGKRIHQDTNLAVFPGNLTNAREMVKVRRGDDVGLDELETKALLLLEYQIRKVYPDGYEKAADTRPRLERQKLSDKKKAALQLMEDRIKGRA